ncbi:MAG TPA: hypothetical protein VEJ67_02875 [Candidatus Cybelea sp.]|nr:hypothetical protein [Candidatus Cybelea sp.]
MNAQPEDRSGFAIRDIAFLVALTGAALLIHGYHPGAEDAEIYLPQIRKILNPALYPFGSEFFESHAHLTVFPHMVATLVRTSHLPLGAVLFICHIASIFLLLWASKAIAAKCFPSQAGRWAAVAMVASLLTLPVTGTDLYLLDQYFNPRSVSTFAILFAVDAVLERRYPRAALWLVFTGLVHPLMAVLGIVYIVLLVSMNEIGSLKAEVAASARTSVAGRAPPALFTRHPSPAFTQTLHDHPYYFLLEWHWYEWLGVVAPLALLAWFSRIAESRGRPVLKRLALSLVWLGALSVASALVPTIFPRFEFLAISQPMRSFQLIYLLLALLGGGLIAETWLASRPARWLALFLPLALGMAYAQVRLFPSDLHIEWPGAQARNPWVQAFLWARAHTPVDAIFALDSGYMAVPGEDFQGFRAIAARSRLADATKDWSASAMFPGLPLADECLEQVRAARGFTGFRPSDFERLKDRYDVTWIVIEQPGASGLACPYQNGAVRVCRVN